MAELDADWLALREPADGQARSQGLVDRLLDWLGSAPPRRPLRLVDLGCGTGSNLRCLAPLLGGEQHWTCLDRDPKRLAALTHQTAAWASSRGLIPDVDGDGLRILGSGLSWRIETQGLDLTSDGAGFPLTPGTLVVTAAFVDRVSEPWLSNLLHDCRENGAPLLAVLNADGRVELAPREPLDGLLIALVNGHQSRDVGRGTRLGLSAARVLDRLGRALGYQVHWAQSDWDLGPNQRDLQAALLTHWADAAREQAREGRGVNAQPLAQRMAAIERWTESRLDHLAAGRSNIRVGHQDVLLLPPGSRIQR